MRFDSRLFVISYSLLIYTRNSSMNNFNQAIRDLINYVAAEKRIRVILNNHITKYYISTNNLQQFLLLDESERDNRLTSSSVLQLSDNQDQTKIEKTTRQTPTVICNLKHARWEQVLYLQVIETKHCFACYLDWNIFIEKHRF